MSDIKISVITPSFNQGKYIRKNIESVIYQDYKNYEHIIVDGGSDDETLSIIKEYKNVKWISEKDDGPVDAIIKGINISTGNIITWLNSDDYYIENVFGEIEKSFRTNNIQIIVGNLRYKFSDSKYNYDSKHQLNYNFNYLSKVNSDIITQPSTFFTKDLYYKTTGFNRNLKLVWDYDLFLKMFKIENPYLLNKTIAVQRIYDNTLTRKYARRQAYEIFKVAKSFGAKYNDPIMKIILKRFIFPSSVKLNPGLIIQIYRKLKNLNFKH